MRISLFIPILIALVMLSGLGTKQPASVIDGGTVVTAIVVCFGIWLSAYYDGKFSK